ncbi:ATP-binding protein [Thermodesulfobacteriota bacterium B35]
MKTLADKGIYQQIVSSILRIAMEDLSLDEILSHALGCVLRYNRCNLMDKGAISLMAEEADYLVLRAHRGFDRAQLAACRRIPLGTCHCGRAALTGQIQYSASVDHLHDIRPERVAPHGHYCVPICAGDDMLGVLTLYLRHGHAQSSDEKEMLWAISNILASVIRRKKIEIQLCRLVRKQELMITRISDEQKMTESIIQCLHTGLMVCDLEAEILRINPFGRMVLGRFLAAGEPEPTDPASFARLAPVRAMLEGGRDAVGSSGEVRCRDRSGMERVLRYSVVALENASGEHIGLILQFDDVTETLRIGREMTKMNRLRTVAEIAAAVAHEVRNPLAGIKTMSQAIEENCARDDDNREYVTRIIRQVDRLNDLLTDFFTYATPGTAKREQVCLRQVVRETWFLLDGRFARRRIVLREAYAKALPDLHVDPRQLQQVLLNLMLNSIDAIGTDGEIRIRARVAAQSELEQYGGPAGGPDRERESVLVFFADNGRGLETEDADRIFEPFFTTRHHGSGLGLAIARRILHENNARIMLDPTVREGVGFVMVFEGAPA